MSMSMSTSMSMYCMYYMCECHRMPSSYSSHADCALQVRWHGGRGAFAHEATARALLSPWAEDAMQTSSEMASAQLAVIYLEAVRIYYYVHLASCS